MPRDTFVRKAQTALPGGKVVERDWWPVEKWRLYCDGWRDGAAIKAMRPTHIGLGPYERGYADGRKAYSAASAREAKRQKYKPSILRTAAEERTSADKETP